MRCMTASTGSASLKVFRRRELLTWTRETAYATGLVASDGYLSAPRTVGFGSADFELVETYLRCVDRPLKYGTVTTRRERTLDHKTIVSRRPYYYAHCSDPWLYDFLASAGLGPRKSRSLGPISAPTMLLPDLIRGLLDGDGSIVVFTDAASKGGQPYRRTRLRVVFYSASHEHLAWLQAILTGLAIRASLQEDRRTSWTYYGLVLSDRQAIALLTTLYEDPRAPRLERKHQIWLSYRAARSLPEYVAFL